MGEGQRGVATKSGQASFTCLSLSPKRRTSSIIVNLGCVLFSSSICKSRGSETTLLSVLDLRSWLSELELTGEETPESEVPPAARRLESPPVDDIIREC